VVALNVVRFGRVSQPLPQKSQHNLAKVFLRLLSVQTLFLRLCVPPSRQLSGVQEECSVRIAVVLPTSHIEMLPRPKHMDQVDHPVLQPNREGVASFGFVLLRMLAGRPDAGLRQGQTAP
jgi:hypothetical protein